LSYSVCQIEEIPLIILAAGFSQRMGFPKGLLDWKGMPLLKFQIESYAQMGGKTVLLVLGHYAQDYLMCLDLKANWEKPLKYKNITIHLIMNKNPILGPFSSIQLACNYGQFLSSGFFILPLDTPCPNQEVWKKLIQKNNYMAVLPSFEQKKGHPVFISNKFSKILMSEKNADMYRLDYQLKKLSSSQCKVVPVNDHQILLNLNTPEDLRSCTF